MSDDDSKKDDGGVVPLRSGVDALVVFVRAQSFGGPRDRAYVGQTHTYLGGRGRRLVGRTYRDVGGAVAPGRVPARCLDAALSVACRRSARGLILEGRWQEALTYARRAWSRAPTMAARRGVLGLASVAFRRLGGSLKRALRSRPG